MSARPGEMARRVEPEWLDYLPADDARARRSRRDLRRVNALMSNAALVAAELRRAFPQGPASLAEIGAGDGDFARRLVRRAPPARATALELVDRQALVEPQTLALLGMHGWRARAVEADVFDWLAAPGQRFDAIVANLFVHHFEGQRLAALLDAVSRRTGCFIACEPRRGAAALAGAHLLGAIGCNDVTRHDAVASVRAGFRGRELSALWPRRTWRCEERAAGLFSHLFVARAP